jgi:hypothetical protein
MPGWALELAPDAIVLGRGLIVYAGTSRDLIHDPEHHCSADGRGGAGHDLERQGIVPGLAAEIHRVDAEQCEAGHDRCRLVEISAERCR